MIPKLSVAPRDQQISELVAILVETEGRLVELTGGEIDSVTDIDGQTFLLQRAQNQIRISEMAKQATMLKELRAIFDLVPAMIWVKDKEGVFLRVNQRVADLVGLEVGEIEGKSNDEVLPAAVAAQFKDDLEVILSAGPKIGVVEKLVESDGLQRWVQSDRIPLVDENGRVSGVVTMVRDITASKQAEEELQRSQIRLVQAQRMEAIGTLASGIAHDFNNILSAIAGNILLARGDVPEGHPVVESLDEVTKAAARGAEVVRQILRFSLSTPRAHTPVAVSDVVNEAVGLLRPTIPSNVELNLQSESDLGLIEADSTEVYQVVMNLAGNAIHAMSAKGGKLGVSCDSFEVDADSSAALNNLATGRYIRVTVSDTGPGIDGATLPRIFEPFFTTKRANGGTGLGLSVAYGIMQQHRGTITVDSDSRKGTIFRLYFPVISGNLSRVERKVREPVHGAGQRIMLVDDDEALVLLSTRMLKRLNYRVSGFEHSLEALEAFRADPYAFDAIITDRAMPHLDGPSFVRNILAIRGDIPIIMLTGYIGPTDEAATLKLGIRHLILKPNTIADLAETLSAMLKDVSAR